MFLMYLRLDTATYAGLSSDLGLFIINITDINSPSLVSTVFNGSLSGDASSFVVPHTTFVSIDGSTYAISAHSSGVLITNVNNPASPSFVAYVTDGQDGFTTLNSVQFIATKEGYAGLLRVDQHAARMCRYCYVY